MTSVGEEDAMKEPVAIAERFAELLAEAYGPALQSVILYGSVPRGDAVAGLSDINLLVVVERIHVPDLERVTPLARHWIVERRCAPMLIGADEWPRAGDAFAIAEATEHILIHLQHAEREKLDIIGRARLVQRTIERLAGGRRPHDVWGHDNDKIGFALQEAG